MPKQTVWKVFFHRDTDDAILLKRQADGYTLLINTSAQAYSAALSKNLRVNAQSDS